MTTTTTVLHGQVSVGTIRQMVFNSHIDGTGDYGAANKLPFWENAVFAYHWTVSPEADVDVRLTVYDADGITITMAGDDAPGEFDVFMPSDESTHDYYADTYDSHFRSGFGSGHYSTGLIVRLYAGGGDTDEYLDYLVCTITSTYTPSGGGGGGGGGGGDIPTSVGSGVAEDVQRIFVRPHRHL